MQKLYRDLTDSFRRGRGAISPLTFKRVTSRLNHESEVALMLLQASGYPIEESGDIYILKTYSTDYRNQKFCIVDIETNGSKPDNSQVIEIGAVMLQNGRIIDRFESLIRCDYVPDYITKITGITTDILRDAPTDRDVFQKFRLFLEDSIFVAHNVNFDFNFLDSSFQKFGLGSIGNFNICSIKLAKKTIEAERYGLAHLNNLLNLGVDTHHRAYSDALTTAKLLKIILKKFQRI